MHRTTSLKHHSNHRRNEIVAEADTLLQRVAHSSLGEEAQALMAKLREAVDVIKATAEEAQQGVKTGIAVTEHAVKTHPWRSVSIAAGVGFVLGLIGRRWLPKAG